MSTQRAFAIGAIFGAVGALLMVGAYQYRSYLSPASLGAPSKVVAGQTTETVPVKSIQAYSGDTKRKLRLPDDVVQNDSEHVVASTTARGDKHPQTVTAVTDTQTGTTQLYIKQEPLPWFSIQRSGELSIASGYHGSKHVMQLAVSEDLAQVKMLRFGVTGQLETDGKVFVGLRVSAGW